jgi:hypothetical protein
MYRRSTRQKLQTSSLPATHTPDIKSACTTPQTSSLPTPHTSDIKSAHTTPQTSSLPTPHSPQTSSLPATLTTTPQTSSLPATHTSDIKSACTTPQTSSLPTPHTTDIKSTHTTPQTSSLPTPHSPQTSSLLATHTTTPQTSGLLATHTTTPQTSSLPAPNTSDKSVRTIPQTSSLPTPHTTNPQTPGHTQTPSLSEPDTTTTPQTSSLNATHTTTPQTSSLHAPDTTTPQTSSLPAPHKTDTSTTRQTPSLPKPDNESASHTTTNPTHTPSLQAPDNKSATQLQPDNKSAPQPPIPTTPNHHNTTMDDSGHHQFTTEFYTQRIRESIEQDDTWKSMIGEIQLHHSRLPRPEKFDVEVEMTAMATELWSIYVEEEWIKWINLCDTPKDKRPADAQTVKTCVELGWIQSCYEKAINPTLADSSDSEGDDGTSSATLEPEPDAVTAHAAKVSNPIVNVDQEIPDNEEQKAAKAEKKLLATKFQTPIGMWCPNDIKQHTKVENKTRLHERFNESQEDWKRRGDWKAGPYTYKDNRGYMHKRFHWCNLHGWTNTHTDSKCMKGIHAPRPIPRGGMIGPNHYTNIGNNRGRGGGQSTILGSNRSLVSNDVAPGPPRPIQGQSNASDRQHWSNDQYQQPNVNQNQHVWGNDYQIHSSWGLNGQANQDQHHAEPNEEMQMDGKTEKKKKMKRKHDEKKDKRGKEAKEEKKRRKERKRTPSSEEDSSDQNDTDSTEDSSDQNDSESREEVKRERQRKKRMRKKEEGRGENKKGKTPNLEDTKEYIRIRMLKYSIKTNDEVNMKDSEWKRLKSKLPHYWSDNQRRCMYSEKISTPKRMLKLAEEIDTMNKQKSSNSSYQSSDTSDEEWSDNNDHSPTYVAKTPSPQQPHSTHSGSERCQICKKDSITGRIDITKLQKIKISVMDVTTNPPTKTITTMRTDSCCTRRRLASNNHSVFITEAKAVMNIHNHNIKVMFPIVVKQRDGNSTKRSSQLADMSTSDKVYTNKNLLDTGRVYLVDTGNPNQYTQHGSPEYYGSH